MIEFHIDYKVLLFTPILKCTFNLHINTASFSLMSSVSVLLNVLVHHLVKLELVDTLTNSILSLSSTFKGFYLVLLGDFYCSEKHSVSLKEMGFNDCNLLVVG